MHKVVRVDFHERDQQWIVTLWDSDGHTRPGEPFPASDHKEFTKLQQVLYRLQMLGYEATNIPYNKVNATSYNLDVKPR
jgi:hypothetical protein